MGEAKRRGTFEQRQREAIAAGRRPGAPPRTQPYRPRLRLSTPGTELLERRFKVLGEQTIEDLQAAVAAQRAKLQAEQHGPILVAEETVELAPAVFAAASKFTVVP